VEYVVVIGSSVGSGLASWRDGVVMGSSIIRFTVDLSGVGGSMILVVEELSGVLVDSARIAVVVGLSGVAVDLSRVGVVMGSSGVVVGTSWRASLMVAVAVESSWVG
jgi:hypothetical protein